MIIAVTGTPGTGKTLVAKQLSKDLGYKLVDLNKIAEEKKLYSGFDRERNTKVVDIGALATEVKGIVREERITKGKANLVLDGHFSQDVPNDLIVVLRTDPKVLRERLQGRSWNTAKIEENIQAEIMEVVKQEALGTGRRVLEINTTGKEPEIVVKEIERSL